MVFAIIAALRAHYKEIKGKYKEEFVINEQGSEDIKKIENYSFHKYL